MIFASNGATLHICTTPQTSEPADQAAWEALTYVETLEVESIGSLGDTSNEITFASLSDSRTQRVKGTRDAGTIEIVMGADYADAGQIALIAAEKTDGNYAFKIVFDDAPSGGTESVRYFLAMVGSANETLDTADNVIKLNSSLWINSAITRVDAAGP